MSVCPAQKSMSSTWISVALPGEELEGSQIRGIPIVSATSVLPQAKIFPVGSSVMWSGTMSQETTGPHLPEVASRGNGDSVTGEEVTLAAPAMNSSVWSPVPSMPRSPNFATPLLLVVAVRFPCSVPLPDARLAVISTPPTGFPVPSFTSTAG